MKSTAERRNRCLVLATSAALAVAVIGGTAGCAAQAEPVSGTRAAVPSDAGANSSALPVGEAAATTPAATQAAQVAATPAAKLITTQVAATPAKASATKATAAPATTNQASASSRTLPAIEDCGQGPALMHPTALVLACADDGILAKDLKWSNWSGTSATATGIMTSHVCTPNCAESTKWDSVSAEVILTDPVSENGKVLFTKAVLRITGALPAGFASRVTTFGMAPTPN